MTSISIQQFGKATLVADKNLSPKHSLQIFRSIVSLHKRLHKRKFLRVRTISLFLSSTSRVVSCKGGVMGGSMQ